MSKVKLLISASGSGLTNYVLMQKNQKVIELMTTIATSGNDQVMSFFLELSVVMNHQYISIPHSRDPEEIIKSFKNNKYLMELISE
jgi:capsular polysaccharide biosynthesis protein